MKKIIILAFDGALASAITGVVDLFAMAGVSWNRIQKQNVQRLFQVKIASQHGQAVQCINGIKLYADLAFSEITDADIIIVPTIGAPILDVLAQNSALIEVIKNSGNCRAD
jgi:hypothetical protein